MKKVILSVFVLGAILSSCSNGTQVEASDAENVELVENEATVEYTTINESSKLDWRATHLGGVGERFGIISLKDASFLVNNGVLSNAKVDIDMLSLSVDSFSEEEAEQKENLTGHLLADDFFKTETYPTSTFELTSIESTEGDYNSTLTGNLTILDATKSITFNANVNVSDESVSMVSEKFIIDRTDWGLSYHIEGSEGVPVDYIISNDLEFTINVTIEK